jgi:hypothetical protein
MTVSLAPGSSEPPAPEVLDGAQARLTAAANGGPTADYNFDLLSIALTPLAALRALFKAALESNENQQDDALAARKRDLEISRSKQLAAAGENTRDADNINSHRWQTLTWSCAGAGCAVAGAASNEYKISDYLIGVGKGAEAMATFTETGQKADSKESDATVALYQADNDLAKGNVSDQNDMFQRLLREFQQMADAMKEIRDSHAQSIRIA